MRWVSLWAGLVWLAVALPGWAAAPKPYQRGEVISVEQKARTRTLYYLVNTPVTQDDPYYVLTLKVNQTIYVGEFTPRHASDTLPQAWSPGSEVEVRVEKHHFFVKSPGDDVIDFAVVKRVRAESWQPPDAGKSAD